MRIGMEETVPEDHVEEDACTATCQIVEIRSGCAKLVRPVEGDAVEKLHRQHAAG